MRRVRPAMLIRWMLALLVAGAAFPWLTAGGSTVAAEPQPIIIDDFSTPQAEIANFQPGTRAASAVTDEGILGGVRVISAEHTGTTTVNSFFWVGVKDGYYYSSRQTNGQGNGAIWWHGNTNTNTLDPTGLGGVDLTGGGYWDGFALVAGRNVLLYEVVVTVYTDGTHYSTASFMPPFIPSLSEPQETVRLPFAGFTAAGADGGADFSNVGAITITFFATVGYGPAISLFKTERMNVPPNVNAGGPYSGSVLQPVSIAGQVDDRDDDTITTTWDWEAVGGTSGTCIVANASALTTTVTCTGVGTYRLTLTASDGVNSPVTAEASLTINQESPTITWNPPTSITYGPLGATELGATASVAGSFSYHYDGVTVDGRTVSGPAGIGTVLDVGTYTLTATFTPDDTTNYSSVEQSRPLQVTPATISVHVNNASREYYHPNPTFSGTLTGVVPGDAITAEYTTTATLTSPIGQYPITPTLSDPDDRLINYNVTVSNGRLIITAAQTSITVEDSVMTSTATSVELRATVTSDVPVLAGQVTFSLTDGAGNEIGTPSTVQLSGGQAVITFPTGGPLSTGTYTIHGIYDDPARNYAGSEGQATLTVNAAGPATVTLMPGNTVATVGDRITETVEVLDAGGRPVADGSVVTLKVSGVNTTTLTATTVNGRATFELEAIFPGVDTVTAEAGGVTASATVTWREPPSAGAALILVINPPRPFALVTAISFWGHPSGTVHYQAPDLKLQSSKITSVVATKGSATIFGTATVAGQPVVFRVDVTGGLRDGTVRLRVSNGFDSGVVPVKITLQLS